MALATLSVATSCDSYLDKLPDDRAEVNTPEKATSLLVSAYSNHSPAFLLEMSSDNVMDNGKQYTTQINQEMAYRWQEVVTVGNDDPRSIWNSAYIAVGTANEALASLAKLPDNASNQALKAEALLCRAYAMFTLGNTFCMSYNPNKAETFLGLPYPKEPGVSVDERGTMKQLYENIEADIEAALPYVSDAHLTVPKYHFNSAAAYAFAARFTLYYLKFDKAKQYADKVLGTGTPTLRDVAMYGNLAGVDDIGNAYVRSGENANLMFQTAYSINGRAFRSSSFNRFNHGRSIVSYETFWAVSPWGSGSSNNTLYEARYLYGTNQTIYYPKMLEMFEITDKVNSTGYAHTVDAAFTTDETLLVRAEANALLGNTEASLTDINYWINAHCKPVAGTATRPVMTEASLNDFFNKITEVPVPVKTDKERTIKKPLHPQGFTVEEGTQTNLIYLILQMRRIETWQQGLRFLDIKRYGLEITHNLDGEDPLVFKAGDLRGAIQLPADVVTAGLEPNPRETTNK